MDLTLNEIQTMLQTSAREFMEDQVPKTRVLEIDDSEAGFDPNLWEQMSELGWPSLAIPEEYGGLGQGWVDIGVVSEIMGYYACPSPLLSSAVLSAQAIIAAGSDEQKQSMLPGIAAGQQIFTLAYTEPDYSWSPKSVQLQAAASDGGYVLNGTKLFIPDANVADRILVVARTSNGASPEEGLSLLAVDRTAPGVSVRVMDGWIGPKACEVNFENVEVDPSDVLGEPGEAWGAIELAMDRATAVLCAFMSGGTQAVYDMTREYSQTRIAFGVPIGTFQRVQDHVIDALTDADSAKWTAFEALWQLDEGMADAPVGVSTAKSVASLGFPRACDAAHHVHAGIGADLEYGLTQYTKRARTLQHYLGDHVYHKARMARLLSMAG
jgi:acyl-CoA dehydrogenase